MFYGMVTESETGYAGSASSNEDSGQQTEDSGNQSEERSFSPPSECGDNGSKRTHHNHHHIRKLKRTQDWSELADYSSGNTGSPLSYIDLSLSCPSSPLSDDPDEMVSPAASKTATATVAKKSSLKTPAVGPTSGCQHNSGRKRPRGSSSNLVTKHDQKKQVTEAAISSPGSSAATAPKAEGISKNSLNKLVNLYERSFKKKGDRRRKRTYQEAAVSSQGPKTHFPTSYSLSSSSSLDKKPKPKPALATTTKDDRKKTSSTYHDRAPIYRIGYDIMSQILMYLDPQDVVRVLTLPLSRTWQAVYTIPQDLWKILCLSHPFNAKIDDAVERRCDSTDDSLCSFPICSQVDMRHVFGRYRLLYTSFVQCVTYLEKIKDDVRKGLPPASIGESATFPPGLKGLSSRSSVLNKSTKETSDVAAASSVESLREDEKKDKHVLFLKSGGKLVNKTKTKKHKCEVSLSSPKLTCDPLEGPPKNVVHGIDLPFSCSIYSVVNWMVAFADVLGIQIMCLRVLPFLLEDEDLRATAQRAGLTDIVLQDMVLFPNNAELHAAAFHALVLLARPTGWHEGMIFQDAMVVASGIFNMQTSSGKNGIAVMLDSMRRFDAHEFLQAMGCWSMANIALAPSQKMMLVKLGGISVALNAMMQHPYSAQVQFRAAFALINLVIPPESFVEGLVDSDAVQEHLGSLNDISQKEILDESVADIVNLVVIAMKNFCSSEAILNRCCLVLYNLSLNEDYHSVLLCIPNCYQILEWAMVNYRHDQVMQQSAAGTLQRLQMTLANDNDLRMRLAASIRSQQSSSMERRATLEDGQHQPDPI